MYYAPARPIEIEKFPKGYIKPTGQNLEFLQRPPVDNRRIQDYYGKVQDLPNQQERPYNRVYTQGSSEQSEQFPKEKKQENKLKGNQNQDFGSNINPQRMISPERFQSAPFNTIFTDGNIYKPVGSPQNFAESIVQPLERRLSPSNLRGPNRGYLHNLRDFPEDFQEPGFSFFPKTVRDIHSGEPFPGYRRTGHPGILNDYRRGIPEPILSKRNYGRDFKKDLSYRVIPVTDFRKGQTVDFHGHPPILNDRDALALNLRGYPYLDSDRQRFEPPFEYRAYFDSQVVPAPDYYVPEYRGLPPFGMQREFNERQPYGRGLPYQDRVYPSSYGRMDQQMFREGRPNYNLGQVYSPHEERANGLNQRIKQV
ncbi:unnamed protein product (macronuclear) [Paramecium tetraurelia]|uniref:Uncharacterized protein n=1 Tax=Paramecium tetraurelia TaxID=5888 RepID=A0CS35_PARTE|nr:uncharacterized protein GSPATT00009874001 [Paramecium tetraurelia]CAK73602.1 unnamed protein product [Paramecium tetraurelia]|eukprot:XP_001440999.1 hypothetical protein (macronuclear) [Paramecium tetraurelia strain d4-2]